MIAKGPVGRGITPYICYGSLLIVTTCSLLSVGGEEVDRAPGGHQLALHYVVKVLKKNNIYNLFFFSLILQQSLTNDGPGGGVIFLVDIVIIIYITVSFTLFSD